MAIHLELVNFDQLIAQLKKTPLILNDLRYYSEVERTNLMKQFLTEYSSDRISTLPQCDCGYLVGEYTIGQVCPKCNTTVINESEIEIEPHFWLRSPIGVSKLINPTVWYILKQKFKRGSFNFIRYFTDDKVPEPNRPIKVLERIKELNIPRNYNSFVDNFSTYLEMLINSTDFKNRGLEDIIKLMDMYPDCIFSKYIPIPHRDMLVIEKVKHLSYMDATSQYAISAFNLMAGIDKKLADRSLYIRMDRTVKAIDMIAEYYAIYSKVYLSPKEGIFRHHIFSNRTHFSFRAVISSLTEPHRYNEIHIPWGVAIGVFKIHILNKLEKLGMGHNEAIGFINRSINELNPTMEKILDDLINESKDRQIPFILVRNPSLLMGSVHLLYITKVIKNIHDNTIKLPILLTGFYNADFDGDEMNGLILIDVLLENLNYPLSSHRNIHDMSLTPYKISDHLLIPKPVISMISSWLNCDD